jgi:hypothetical protein
MLTAPETIENIVAATPGLENDPVALGKLGKLQWMISKLVLTLVCSVHSVK